jgi:hypothetical protein
MPGDKRGSKEVRYMIEPEINFIDRNEKEPVFVPEDEGDEEE